MALKKFWQDFMMSQQDFCNNRMNQREDLLANMSEEATFNYDVELRRLGLASNFFIEQSDLPWPSALSIGSAYITDHRGKPFGIDIKNLYKLNSLKLRSDEFKKQHDGKHILFAGCSVTFGEGVPEDYSWPKIVYNKISKDEKVSGYFNVAVSGFSNLSILLQVLKYIRIWGVPDTIFILFPDTEREMFHSQHDSRVHTITASLYKTLLYILDVNGSRLIASSWDAIANEDYDGDKIIGSYDPRFWFDRGFYRFRVSDRHMHLFERCEKIKELSDFEKEFLQMALDDQHPGLAEHEFYANFMLDAYRGVVQESYPESNIKKQADDEFYKLSVQGVM